MNQQNSEIDADVVSEALQLLKGHADSPVWMDASEKMAADHSLAVSLLQGELEGEHTPAAKASSEVLDG